jgi:hypothetical protein
MLGVGETGVSFFVKQWYAFFDGIPVIRFLTIVQAFSLAIIRKPHRISKI